MGRLSAYLPADQGIAARNALTRLAHHARTDGDTRTLDQLRVDTLVTTLTDAADHLHPQAENTTPTREDATPTGQDATTTGEDAVPTTAATRATGREPKGASKNHKPAPKNHNRGKNASSNPRVTITVSASTLLGEDEHPGYLQGHGAIIASMARQVAATGTWQCAITDSTHGTLLGLGKSAYSPKYRPTQALRHYLITRDRACRVPGCHQPAEVCDLDHRIPWPVGYTCDCCMECLCKNHHRLKHECGFTLTPSTNPTDPPGTLIWTTPAGHPYPCYPAALNNPNPFRANSSPNPTRPTTPCRADQPHRTDHAQ